MMTMIKFPLKLPRSLCMTEVGGFAATNYAYVGPDDETG